jgi:type III pantothenate kinase
MVLAIDSGNSFSKIGWFQGNQLVNTSYGLTFEEVIEVVNDPEVERVIFSSVSYSTEEFLGALQRSVPVLRLTNYTPMPVGIHYDTPETLGVDRLAAAVGANFLFPSKELIVIDAGTCITYDVVDSQGVFQGGAIAPGLKMRFRAMHEFTKRLPMIDEIGSKRLIGKSTKEAMQSGVVNGMVAEIEGMVEAYREEYPNADVVVCGGDLGFFESRLKLPIFAVPELVLVGLNRILQYNDV